MYIFSKCNNYIWLWSFSYVYKNRLTKLSLKCSFARGKYKSKVSLHVQKWWGSSTSVILGNGMWGLYGVRAENKVGGKNHVFNVIC